MNDEKSWHVVKLFFVLLQYIDITLRTLHVHLRAFEIHKIFSIRITKAMKYFPKNLNDFDVSGELSVLSLYLSLFFCYLQNVAKITKFWQKPGAKPKC